jgi:hypothetical protein
MARGEATVNTDKANRRSAPAFGDYVVGRWNQGEVLTIWQAQPPWYYCQNLATGVLGWAHADVLTMQGEVVP